MMKRRQVGPLKLSLHRETLAPLNAAALRQAPGGLNIKPQMPDPYAPTGTCPTAYHCPSVNYLCSLQ